MIKCANCKCDLGEEITASKDELKENFGNWKPEECDVVCDECYNKILAWKKEVYN